MGKFVDFNDLSIEQQTQARNLRPKWLSNDFVRFAFYVRDNEVISARPGHHKLTKQQEEEFEAKYRDLIDNRSDMLKKWTGGPPFHIDRK